MDWYFIEEKMMSAVQRYWDVLYCEIFRQRNSRHNSSKLSWYFDLSSRYGCHAGMYFIAKLTEHSERWNYSNEIGRMKEEKRHQEPPEPTFYFQTIWVITWPCYIWLFMLTWYHSEQQMGEWYQCTTVFILREINASSDSMLFFCRHCHMKNSIA